MPLVLNGATSGSTTVQATDAVTATLTLPSLTGTLLSTTSPKAGNVLQVVNATYSTATVTSSSTFVDTGLTVTITPTNASSKILVLVDQAGIQKQTTNTWVDIKLLRGATDLTTFCADGAFNNTTTLQQIGSTTTCYLDSPATTSATTYKTQFRSGNNSASAIVQVSSSASTITVMEIAA